MSGEIAEVQTITQTSVVVEAPITPAQPTEKVGFLKGLLNKFKGGKKAASTTLVADDLSTKITDAENVGPMMKVDPLSSDTDKSSGVTEDDAMRVAHINAVPFTAKPL